MRRLRRVSAPADTTTYVCAPAPSRATRWSSPLTESYLGQEAHDTGDAREPRARAGDEGAREIRDPARVEVKAVDEVVVADPYQTARQSQRQVSADVEIC